MFLGRGPLEPALRLRFASKVAAFFLPALFIATAWLLCGDHVAIAVVAPAVLAAAFGLMRAAESRRRESAESLARNSMSRYELLAQHSSDMIVSFDPCTQQRTYVSPSCRRLYGYEPEEAVAMAATQIIHPDDFPAVQAALNRLELGQQAPVTYRGRRKDGVYIWVEASLTPWTNPETGGVEIVSVVRDVSERVRYETALREAKEQADAANRTKSEFLSTVSHELRTPLNAIIGFSDLMSREIMGPVHHPRYRSYIADIHRSGMLLLNLINEILDLSKAEAGKLTLNEDTFDVGELIRDVVRLLEPRIKEAELAVDVDVPKDLPLLWADERKTEQVLFNLVSNSLKFTPPGGHISIIARAEPQRGFALEVRDTGIGIAADQQNRVFEPFVQIDSQLNRKFSGTGLGLPIVKAVMQLHRGTVTLTSIEGTGTEITVVFPPDRVIEANPPINAVLPVCHSPALS